MALGTPVPLTLLLEHKPLELTAVNMDKKQLRSIEVSDPKVQVVGLSIAGFVDHLYPSRIQLFGKSERDYCLTLSDKERRKKAELFLSVGPIAVVFTAPVTPEPFLVELADMHSVPLFLTKKSSSVFLDYLKDYLNHELAINTSVHAQLLEIFGVGVLLMGESGIGKSETTLDVIMRGHRMIADDVVVVRYLPPNTLIGSSHKTIEGLLEIRGIGLIDVRRMFGVASLSGKKEIDLVIRLTKQNPDSGDNDYERIGSTRQLYELLGASKPVYNIPVREGSNIGSVVETAVRDFLLKEQGINTAQEFENRLDTILKQHGEE